MLNITHNTIKDKAGLKNLNSFRILNSRHNSRRLINTLYILGAVFLLILFLPWTQNIKSVSKVTALKPNQRPQTIHSIIAGRIEKWYVQEGQFVKKGDTILFISETKEEYLDPKLVQNTEQQLKAKELTVKSYFEKVNANDEQIDALIQSRILKLEQARNKLIQANLKVQSDSIDLSAAQLNYKIAKDQLLRMEELFKEGLKSLTDLEVRKQKLQETQAKVISQENKFIGSKNEVLNAKIELQSINADYSDKIAKSESEKYASLSNMYDAEAIVSKLQNQYVNYSIRSGMYYILAPQDGYITKAIQSGLGETIKEGTEIISIMPFDYELAVEMYVNPMDIPLLDKGQHVQIQFDGWPSIIFSGWPGISYGTYGGEVVAIDNFVSENGKYRVLVAHDKDYPKWPKEIRLGAGAQSLTLLKEVPVWYELWRQINGFPPDYYKQFNATGKQNKDEKSSHKFYLVIMLFLISTHSFGQVDTLQQLSLPQFMQMVKQFHPIAKQADLIPKSAEASTLAARGAFDPKLFYDFRNKFYDDKNYYSLGNGGFYIPTWFGLELKAGYERNQGNYLNPENSMPDQGLLYSQISLPLLQGLLIDERRATLKQAKLYVDLSEFDKINVLNELLYRAGKAYWDWYLAYANLKIHENAVVLSQTRFEAVRKTFVFGDRPAIDTVEANIQLQDRIINLQQALMEFRTKSLLLSTFLWIADDTPIELTNKTIPTDIVKDDERYFNLNVAAIDSLIESHPSLMVYDFKIKQLKIEERFKKDKLKPKLNINYNPLFSADNLNLTYQNNYKWGMSVAFPILLRKERGDLQLTRIKIENTQYENKGKRIELLNKTKASINEFSNYKIQIDIYTKNVSNYERLWQSERKLFDRGESSLFMINSREMSYINAQIKLNEIINKNKKAALETVYSFGKLSVNY